MTGQELNERAARLRGFRPMLAEEIAGILGVSAEEVHLLDPPLWIWRGGLSEQPREAITVAVHWTFELHEGKGFGTIICRGCPDYINGDGWWYLAKELPSPARQKCVANWREAPRRVVEDFIKRAANE